MSELNPKPSEFRYRGQDTQISLESLNQTLRGMNRVLTGDGVQLKKVGDRFIVENRPEVVRESTNLRNFVVLEEFDDYLSCVFFDFTYTAQDYDEQLGVTLQELGETAVPVNVAKPYWLQVTPFVDSSIDHTGETIKPVYVAGDIIVGMRAPTGVLVDGEPVEWGDINTAGRTWQGSSSVNDWSKTTSGILNTNSIQTGKGQKRSEAGLGVAPGWCISHAQDYTAWYSGLLHEQTEFPFASYGTKSTLDPRGGVGGYFGFMNPIDETLYSGQSAIVFRQDQKIIFETLTNSVSPSINNGVIATPFTIPATLDDTVTVEIGDTGGLTAGDVVIILGTTTEHGDDCYLSGAVDSVTNGTEFVLQLKGIQKGATFGDEVDSGIAYRVQYASGAHAISYTPGNASDWSGSPPNNIGDALDRLAAAGGATPVP